MTSFEYPLRIRPLEAEEGGGYLVEFPDLQGCMSDGKTPEEALRNAADALDCWLAAVREAGRPVPPPPSPPVERQPVNVSDDTYAALVRVARAEGVSVDALAAALLNAALHGRSAFGQGAEPGDGPDRTGRNTPRSGPVRRRA